MSRARGFILAVVFFALPGLAWAQSPDILDLISQYESGGNPTAQNLNSTSSGLYGQINSTWAQSLQLCGCGTTAEYPNEASAPVDVQDAAEAALLQSDGLSDYTCAGCDPALTAAINAAGGPQAFAAQIAALSTNPATYAAAGGGGLTVSTTDGTIGSAAAAAGATGATAGASFNPFTYLWNQYSAAIAGPLAAELGAVQTMIQSPLLSLLSLSVMLMSLIAYTGRMVMVDFFNRIIRIAAVVALTGVGSSFYNQYVVQFFGGLPTWFSQNIVGTASTNPAANFDIVLHNFTSAASNTWWGLPYGATTLFLDGPIIAVCFAIVFVVLGLMFTVWLIAQALLQLLIVLGPLMILGILFDHTDGWFHRWVSACMLMIFVTLAADMVSSIMLKVIIGALNALPFSGAAVQATQNVFNLGGHRAGRVRAVPQRSRSYRECCSTSPPPPVRRSMDHARGRGGDAARAHGAAVRGVGKGGSRRAMVQGT